MKPFGQVLHRKWIFILSINLLCLVSFVSAASITHKQDSLIQQGFSLSDEREKAEIFNQLCFNLCYSNPDTSLYFGFLALEIGQKLKDNSLIGKAYNRIGIVKDVTVQWDSALVYYNWALEYAEKAKDTTTLASAYNNIGLIYWNKGLLDQAVENFNHSLRLAEKIKLSRSIANAFNNIGLVYWDQYRINDALDYQFRALDIRLQTNDEYGEGASYSNIGMLYDEKQKYDSAIIYFRKAIQIKTRLNDLYGLGKVYTNIGLTFENKGFIDSAEIYLRKAIETHLSTQNYYNAASSMFNLATTLFDLKKYNQSIQELEPAMEIAEEYQFHKLIYKIYFYQGLNYRELKNFENAANYFFLANQAKDSIYNIERDRAVEEIQSKYENEKKNKEIAILEKKQVEQSLKLLKRKRFIFILLALVLLTILSAIILIQRYQSRAATRRNLAIIREREKGLKAMVKATEEERKRIAKDLHDGVGQQVTGLKLYLQQMKLAKDENLSKAAKINEIVNELGEDIRSISHQMMPRSLQELGLVDAIDDMLDKSFGSGRLKYKFDHFGVEHRFNEDVELAVFRNAQELINNVIKHAEATDIRIQLYQRKELLILIVEDNGKGISGSHSRKNGYGMLTIQNRLKLVNGEFRIESKPGHGTTVTVRIKLS